MAYTLATVAGYSNQGGLHAVSLDVRSWLTGPPRPTILIVHAGGWLGLSPADRFINGAVSAATILAGMGFNTVNIDYWGTDTPTAYNRNRPHTDVQSAIVWCRNAGNMATYNLDGSCHLLGHSAGGQLGWYCTMIGVTGTTRPDTMCSWSGPVHMEELVGMFAGPNAQSYMGGLTFAANMATWRLYEPGMTILVNPGIPGRVVGSANEKTAVVDGRAGVQWTQQTQLVTAAAALGTPYIITAKQFSLGAGYPKDDTHYIFTEDLANGGIAGINDIVDLIVPNSGYVAWLASYGIAPPASSGLLRPHRRLRLGLGLGL